MEVKFGEISIGTIFFDSCSGTYWQKISESEAIKQCYLSELYQSDTFDKDEMVKIT